MIKSDVILISGLTDLTFLIIFLYSRVVCLRFILERMKSDPDWIGRCKLLHNFLLLYSFIRSSEKSIGCDVV